MAEHRHRPLLGAGELVGLLADDARRAVVASLVLGADSLADVRAATGLDARAAVTALGRLVDAGLVEEGADGTLVLVAAAFGLAARHAAPAPAGDGIGAGGERARILRAFLQDGRLVAIPTTHAKRLAVLDLVVQDFEPGSHYSELQVNATLRRWHDDVAALRRWLVDVGYLERQRGTYWRCGGPVDPPAPAADADRR